jgi:hypothetical protein
MKPRLISNLFGETMNTPSKSLKAGRPRTRVRFQAASFFLALMLIISVTGQGANTTNTAQRFATPEEAVAALRAATASPDTNALREILGPAGEDLMNPDRIQAANELKNFSTALAQTNHLVRSSDKLVILEVGDDFWPFPVPIAKNGGGWYFDTETGKDELLNRRIGNNELATLPVMRAYVAAQREYASTDHEGKDVLEYAQRLVSSPGKEDGLYWPPKFDGDESPLGPLVAYAQGEGYNPEQRDDEMEVERGPYHGYYFKILKRQGPHTSAGKYDYVINGHMIAGFALIAWPAEYGNSGIMTFIVNQQGRVYQKDLGPKTSKLAGKMEAYDPDSSWTVSSD